MPVQLENCLFDSGSALVLHGKKELVDADLAQLHGLTEGQRASITTVVVSGTNITGECFRDLAFLPNLKALYASRTRVEDDAPFERLPKTMTIVNLDHTDVGDACISKLRNLSNLYLLRLRNTNVTNRGVNVLAAMPNLGECHVDGTAVSEHATQRLLNAIALRKVTFRMAVRFLLHFIQFESRKFGLRVRGGKSSGLSVNLHLGSSAGRCRG